MVLTEEDKLHRAVSVDLQRLKDKLEKSQKSSNFVKHLGAKQSGGRRKKSKSSKSKKKMSSKRKLSTSRRRRRHQ